MKLSGHVSRCMSCSETAFKQAPALGVCLSYVAGFPVPSSMPSWPLLTDLAFPAWAETCLVPANLSWQLGSQDIQITCTHPALLTFFCCCCGLCFLGMVLPQCSCCSLPVYWKQKQWLTLTEQFSWDGCWSTYCKFTQAICLCSYQEVWAFSPDIQYSLNPLHSFHKILSFLSLLGYLEVAMETL